MSLFISAGFVQARPVTVTVTYLEQLGPIEGDGSWGDFYAKATINGTTIDNSAHHLDYPFDPFTTFLIPSGPLLPSPWVLSLNVPDELNSVPVRIEIWDYDSVTSDDQADISPSSKRVVDLTVDSATGKWTGDLTWPQNCSAGPVNGDGAAKICFDISVISESGDADGDGLLDGWELYGYNADGDDTIDIDLPALGANPFRIDLFVEADCMVAANHSHCPQMNAIADVVQSFVNAPPANPDGTTGVQLHVDVGPLFGDNTVFTVAGTGGVSGSYGDLGGGGDQIPEAGNEILLSFNAPDNVSGTKFGDLRQQFFDSRRNVIFRYAIFGHQTNPQFSCISGNGLLPGTSFLVTLGGVRDSASGPACFTTDANGFSVGSRAEQAGAFMHELGHTLGLHHDGDQADYKDKEILFKPNYLSVMNYLFWVCKPAEGIEEAIGVPTSPTDPSLLPGGCDYSRMKLDTLDETNLDECAGIGGGLGFGTQNWNKDSQFQGLSCQPPYDNSTNVHADINNDGICVEAGDDKVLSTVPFGDDFLDDDVIKDGPNRICSTTATSGDKQTTAVGVTPDQVNQLTGYDDWKNITYSLLAIGAVGSGSNTVTEPDLNTIEKSQQYMSELLAPDVTVDKTGPATAKPGDVLGYSVVIKNQGNGPALRAVLTDTAPDGSAQTASLGVIKVGDVITRTSTFTVPADACPGTFTGASASLAFTDFVGKTLTASDTAPLQILDVAPPTLTVSLSPSTLWAPNHKMELVTANIEVKDNCDPNPVITLVSIISSEPGSGYIGAGDQGPDIQGADIGTDDRSFYLRAERGTAGQSTGRVYTITYSATDASGNTTLATATVTVPRDSSSQ